MFVFDSFLYFRCEDHARAGQGVTQAAVLLPRPCFGGDGDDPGARFGSLDHTLAGSGLTRAAVWLPGPHSGGAGGDPGHGFAP